LRFPDRGKSLPFYPLYRKPQLPQDGISAYLGKNHFTKPPFTNFKKDLPDGIDSRILVAYLLAIYAYSVLLYHPTAIGS
jgi:hypothetical protein